MATDVIARALAASGGGGGEPVDAYTKAETNDLLATKADKNTSYTKTEVNNLLAEKEDNILSFDTWAEYNAVKDTIPADTYFVIKEDEQENPIPSHNSLMNRDANECHPINAITGLQAELDKKTDATDTDVLKARVDQLVGEVPPGSADEIADARVMIDGKTSQNLGDAIRTQVSGLKETIAEIEGLKGHLLNSDVLIDGKAIHSSGGLYNNPSSTACEEYIAISNYSAISIKCSTAISGDYYIAVYDSSKTFIKRISVNSIVNKEDLSLDEYSSAYYIRYSIPTADKENYSLTGVSNLIINDIAIKTDISDIKTQLKGLTDVDSLDMMSPYTTGRMNNSGIPVASHNYGITSAFFLAKKGNYIYIEDDQANINIRVAKFSAPSSESFVSIDVNLKKYEFLEDAWYRVDVEYIDTSITADSSIFDNLKGYVYETKTYAYVNDSKSLKDACANSRVKDVYVTQNITTDSEVIVSGSKIIHGNGYNITGNSDVRYLIYFDGGLSVVENAVLSEAYDDVIYAGGNCSLSLKNCDISKSYGNDGIGLHGSANVYVYNCKIHDCRDEGLSTHDTSYCEVYDTEVYKNGYEVGTETESNISFGGLHFGGSKMGIAKNCYCHHNSKNGIGFITIDGNYSSDAIAIAEGNITLNNVENGIRFGGAANVRCLNNMCSDSILFYKKDEHGNSGYVGINSATITTWTGGDEGLVYLSGI